MSVTIPRETTILRDALLRVSTGDYSVRIADSICDGDLCEVASAFDAMVEKLAVNAVSSCRSYEAKAVSEAKYREKIFFLRRKEFFG